MFWKIFFSGIYEPDSSRVYDEHSDLGNNTKADFFQTLTRDWEGAAHIAANDIRTTIIRSG